MPSIACPNCGTSYPEEKVGKYERFKCGKCRTSIEVLHVMQPIEPPAEVEAPPPDAPPPPPPDPQIELPFMRPPEEPAAADPLPVMEPIAAGPTTVLAARKRRGAHPGVWIACSSAACIAVGAVWATSAGGRTATSTDPAADPTSDVGAWKAMSAAESAKAAARLVETTDLTNAAAVKKAAEFFAARGDDAGAKDFARKVIEKSPDDAWAHGTLGHVDLAAEVDAVLEGSEQAEYESDPSFSALKKERTQHAAAWWADAEAAAKTRALVADVKRADAKLATPYWHGVVRWLRRQRSIEVMQDSPEIHALVGPYVVFVSLNAPKDADAKAVPKEESERAAKVLERTKNALAACYDGWLAEMGPIFGFKRYGEDEADFDTLLKANVFAKPEDFFRYNARVEASFEFRTRAYYWAQNDRFITAWDAGAPDDQAGERALLLEATHQLAHFYTWDITRKMEDRPVDWSECAWRPLWSGVGFAEFFASSKVADGKRVWMQPLDERLRQIWIYEEILKDKGWQTWRLSDFFVTQHGGQLSAIARNRTKSSDDDWTAESGLTTLFYAKAWSFVYFLWYAQEDGRPKYRDRYVEYLKAEFHPQLGSREGEVHLFPVGSGDFKRILRIEDPAKLAEVEGEWNEFTGKLVAAEKKPEWDKQRADVRKKWGLEPK